MDNKSKLEYIKEYQKNKYANDPTYRDKILEKNKKNYYEKINDPEYKEKTRLNNKINYEKIKDMKKRLLLLEKNSNQ